MPNKKKVNQSFHDTGSGRYATFCICLNEIKSWFNIHVPRLAISPISVKFEVSLLHYIVINSKVYSVKKGRAKGHGLLFLWAMALGCLVLCNALIQLKLPRGCVLSLSHGSIMGVPKTRVPRLQLTQSLLEQKESPSEFLPAQGSCEPEGPKCWRRRSLRGHDYWLTHKVDPGNQRLLIPSPVLGRYILPTILTIGPVSRR